MGILQDATNKEDFNFVTDDNTDKRGGTKSYDEFGSENLKTIYNDFNLLDSFRYKHNNKLINSLRTIAIRLDHFYISRVICKDPVQVSHVVPHIIMDHDMINIVIKLLKDEMKETGPGLWKCNVSVLSDKYFQDDFCSL